MRVPTNGIELEVQVEGPADGELVVLLHGFPELGYSWRDQVPALVGAGYRVWAPDLRGYGSSDAPSEVGAYALTELCRDVVGLIDAADRDRAVLVGHDWGAEVAWRTAVTHPSRVSAVAGLSVPPTGRAPAPPLEIFRRRLGDGFYMCWFQEPGVAEELLERDVRGFLTADDWRREALAERTPPHAPPPFQTEAELRVYVDAFTRSGFRGPLNWYRNIDRNWRDLAAQGDATIAQPALFITGARDPVRRFMPADGIAERLTDLHGVHVLSDAGHWITQERPTEVNRLLLAWLAELSR